MPSTSQYKCPRSHIQLSMDTAMFAVPYTLFVDINHQDSTQKQSWKCYIAKEQSFYCGKNLPSTVMRLATSRRYTFCDFFPWTPPPRLTSPWQPPTLGSLTVYIPCSHLAWYLLYGAGCPTDLVPRLFPVLPCHHHTSFDKSDVCVTVWKVDPQHRKNAILS